MKPQHLFTLALILAGSWWLSAQTNTNQLAPPTNLRGATNAQPVTKLQSIEAPKTNAPVFHVEQSGNAGTFEDGAIFGALAFSRNPDVRDAKTIVEIARGLWQAQKRADALRQTNNPSK